MRALAVIPARLASTRLPRKVLREIAGKTMLERVYTAARNCPQVAEAVIATDSEEVLALCRAKGWQARMTSAAHRSGTDRVNEVAQAFAGMGVGAGAGGGGGYDVYINVQGDEPLARPEHISALLEPMARAEVEVSTVMTPCPAHDVANPNAVKVVVSAAGRALYFSRSTIPFDRERSGGFSYRKHLGFYAYRPEALRRFCALPESALERSERLEQLRFLENGIDIYVAETPFDTVGVDTEEDLARVERILRGAHI